MPDPMTPIERAARALYKQIGSDFDPFNEGEDAKWPEFVPNVLAVAQALREPSEGMKLAGAQIIATIANLGDCDGPAPTSEFTDSARDTHQAMIDQMIAEGAK